MKALEAALYTSADMLWKTIERIWEDEKVLEHWKEGFLIKWPKKRRQKKMLQLRGFMLLSVPGKVLNVIILKRPKTVVDKKLRGT